MNVTINSNPFTYTSHRTAARIAEAAKNGEDPILAALNYDKNPILVLIDCCFKRNYYANQDKIKTKFAKTFTFALYTAANSTGNSFSHDFQIQDAQNNKYSIRLQKDKNGTLVLHNNKLDCRESTTFNYNPKEVAEIAREIQGLIDVDSELRLDLERLMAMNILSNYAQHESAVTNEALDYLRANFSEYQDEDKLEINEAINSYAEIYPHLASVIHEASLYMDSLRE